MIVTLLVALAGMAGTLASALLTQRGANRLKQRELEHADRQRADERNHAHQLRRHQQRCDAYAEFITLAGTLQSVIYELSIASQSEESYEGRFQQARSDRAALLRQTHRVLLEGPEEVSDAAHDLYTAMDQWISVAHRLHKAHAEGFADEIESKRRNFTEGLNRYRNQRSAFVCAARNVIDLG